MHGPSESRVTKDCAYHLALAWSEYSHRPHDDERLTRPSVQPSAEVIAGLLRAKNRHGRSDTTIEEDLRFGWLFSPGADVRRIADGIGSNPRSASPIGWLKLRLGQCQRAPTRLKVTAGRQDLVVIAPLPPRK